MLVNAFLMITMISICYFKTTFLPLRGCNLNCVKACS